MSKRLHSRAELLRENADLRRRLTQREQADFLLARLAVSPELNPLPVVEIDIHAGIQYANQAARDLFPDLFSRGLEHPWIAGIKPPGDDAGSRDCQPALRQVTVGAEVYLQAAYWLEGKSRARVYGRNLGERPAQPQALTSSRDLLRAVVDVAPDAVYVKDPNGKYLLFNREACRILGRKLEEVLGHDDTVIFPAAEAKAIMGFDRKVLESGNTLVCEQTVTTAAGDRRVYLVTRGPLIDAHGTITGLFGIAKDITALKQSHEEVRRARDELEIRVQDRTADLKRTVDLLNAEIERRAKAEQALRESEELYQTLFSSAPLGIGITDLSGCIVAFNYRLREMLGCDSDDLKTRQSTDFYSDPADRDRLLSKLRKHGRVEGWETPLRRKDGSVFLASLRMNELHFSQRHVLMTIAQDITREKQAERHIKGVAALLELFATRSTRKEYLRSVLKLLRSWCDCQGVGVRLLLPDGRIPYAAQLGLDRKFLRQESRARLSGEGCACMRVLSGQSQPGDAECATPQGSLICNHASQRGAQLGGNAGRTACVGAGYESIAHTAIRYRGRLVGTIHLADSRPDRFPPATIAFIETVAPLIGEALHRFQIEESLQESEARFRTMFERHHAVMLLIDPESGAIVDANPAAAEFYGYSQEQLRQMSISDLNQMPPDEIASHRRRALRQNRNYFVFPHRLAGGELRTVEVHSSPIEVKGKRLLFSIVRDITERLLLEKEILDISQKERQRVGRDLHDSLGGMLAGAALLGKAVAQNLQATSGSDAAVAEEVVQCINKAISQTRAIARGLCPVELSGAGFITGLTEFAAETGRRFGISCQFRSDKRLHLGDSSVSTHLFYIVQEAVNNAIRHGKARQILISLGKNERHYRLEIRDDGSGLPEPLPESKGLGLRTMRYRADIIGARFSAARAEPRGTIISCFIPLTNPATPLTEKRK